MHVRYQTVLYVRKIDVVVYTVHKSIGRKVNQQLPVNQSLRPCPYIFSAASVCLSALFTHTKHRRDCLCRRRPQKPYFHKKTPSAAIHRHK